MFFYGYGSGTGSIKERIRFFVVGFMSFCTGFAYFNVTVLLGHNSWKISGTFTEIVMSVVFAVIYLGTAWLIGFLVAKIKRKKQFRRVERCPRLRLQAYTVC